MIVVYKEIKNGKVELTQEELEEWLEKARKEGYNEGYKDGQNTFYEPYSDKKYKDIGIDWHKNPYDRYPINPNIPYPSIPTTDPVNPIVWNKAISEIK